MYLPELELGITCLVSVSIEDRDKQYKSTPKSHLVGRCGKSQRQSKGKWKIACAFKFLHDSDVWAKNIYYTLMSVPKQVWLLPSYIHVDAKECEQAARIL